MSPSTVLITGATSGIGEALFSHYANRVNKIYPCGRNLEKLNKLAQQVSHAHTLAFDVLNKEQIKLAAKEVDSLDLLILNAGDCLYIDDVMQFNADMFARIIDVNLVSLGYLLQALLPKMNKGGQIVLISSAATLLPFPKAQAYGASKAGVDYLAGSLRIDLKPHDIAVSLVHPGFIKTPLTAKNTFNMPFMLSAEQAATRIAQGVSKRKKYIHFPKRLTWFLKLLSLMPSLVQEKLIGSGSY